MNFWIKNIGALLLGIAACIGGYYFGKNSLHKFTSWETAVADISSSRDIVRTATFTYKGQSYIIPVGNGMDRKNESRIATVIFPKEDPGKGEVRNKSMLVIPLVLAVFGLIMIAVAFFSFRHKLSGRPDADPLDPEIIARKEAMKQQVLEMKQKVDKIRNSTNF